MPVRARPAGPPASTVRPRHDGIGRGSSAAAEAVSDALRRAEHPHLTRRRWIALLQTIATWALTVVGLYQFGIIRKVPEPPLPGLAADAVDAAGEAYVVGLTPDSAIGIASAGVTLVLAGMGDGNRWRDRPWLPIALFGKAVGDAIGGVYLTAEQVSTHRRVCSWCTLSAAALAASAPLAWPEARDAIRHLRSR